MLNPRPFDFLARDSGPQAEVGALPASDRAELAQASLAATGFEADERKASGSPQEGSKRVGAPQEMRAGSPRELAPAQNSQADSRSGVGPSVADMEQGTQGGQDCGDGCSSGSPTSLEERITSRGSLLALLPRPDEPSRTPLPAREQGVSHEMQTWSSSDLDREVLPFAAGQSPGFGRKLPKKRRVLRRRESSGKDDTDYEPGLRTYRSRKASSNSGTKHKSLGRARLKLAGVASTVGDVDPGWTTPHGSLVLVAKTLTKSDTLGRVILPRVAVETNMSFLTAYRAYSLAVRDSDGRPWEFVVKSWANGSEQRRVYVLEQASLYLRSNHLREGDIIGICCDEEGNLRVAANTPQLRDAVARPTYGITFAKSALIACEDASAAPGDGRTGASSRALHPATETLRAGAHAAAAREVRKHEDRRSERRPVRSPAALRTKRSAGYVEVAPERGRAMFSLPLTEEDVLGGHATLPAAHKNDPEAWSLPFVTARDDLGQRWELSSQLIGPRRLVTLGDLGDYYRQQAARAGDCLEVAAMKDGTLRLQLDPCPDTRPRARADSFAAETERKRRASSPPSYEPSLVPVRCGQLLGHLDLCQGSIVVSSSDLSTGTSVSVAEFQARAGFETEADWTQTVHVNLAASSVPLHLWLQEQGDGTDHLNRLHSTSNAQAVAPPTLGRSEQVQPKWSQCGRRTSSFVPGGWIGRRLSNGTVASAEDSIAAEVLMSLSEQEHASDAATQAKAALRRNSHMAEPLWALQGERQASVELRFPTISAAAAE